MKLQIHAIDIMLIFVKSNNYYSRFIYCKQFNTQLFETAVISDLLFKKKSYEHV